MGDEIACNTCDLTLPLTIAVGFRLVADRSGFTQALRASRYRAFSRRWAFCSYLWTREAEAGREEGVKERPCAIVLAVKMADERTRVIVLPITHTAPKPPEAGVELPAPVKALLGLDAERSWIMLDEGNEFAWPGPDLRPVAGQGPESVAFGVLPPRLFQAVRQRFLLRVRAKQAGLVRRSE